MRVLIFAPAFAPAVRAGGPSRSATNLALTAAERHEVVVVTPDRDHGATDPFTGLSGRSVTQGALTVYYINTSSFHHWASLLGRLAEQEWDLILLNSIWHRAMALLPAVLSRSPALRGPVALMPRGELEPGALALKSLKKRIGRPIVRAVYSQAVSVFGSTSASESENLNSWFPTTPALITSNIPETIAFGEPERPSPSLRVASVGRIHPTKGILPLINGLARTREPVALRAWGPVESASYWSACRAAIAALPPTASFDHVGLAARTEIPRIFWGADCFVLLTAGENYGHAIAEALQAGCPVIATRPTPWTPYLENGGGDIIEDRNDAAEVAAVLDRWARKTDHELAEARVKARAAYDAFSATSPCNIIDLALKYLAASGTTSPALRTS